MSIREIKIRNSDDNYATVIHPQTNTDMVVDKSNNKSLKTLLYDKADKETVNAHLGDYVKHPAYITAQGTANAITATIDDLTAYVDGMGIVVKITVQNTAAVTLNINGLGAKSIRKANGNTLSSGNLKVGSLYTLRYNATTNFFILQGEGGEYGTATASEVLSGKTIGTENGLVGGAMINRGSVGTQNLTYQNQIYTIPAGYHNGLGKVMATYQAGKRHISGTLQGQNSGVWTPVNLPFKSSIVTLQSSSVGTYSSTVFLPGGSSQFNSNSSQLSMAGFDGNKFTMIGGGIGNTVTWQAYE